MPVITSDEFYIRNLEKSDIEDWYAYLALPAVYELTSWSLTGPDDLIPLWVDYESDHPDSAIRFAIVDRKSDKLIGTTGFHNVSSQNMSAEIAYDLNPEFWGRGLATCCVRSTIAWAFLQLKLRRVQATVLPANRPSIGVLERCGMEQEGVLRNYRMVRGTPMDFLVYSTISK
ncbi:MAG: GNAT family protein [Gammaproteobacteria bacterium]|nr:GNAT family protein [Gammaproteobacteria bacterium]